MAEVTKIEGPSTIRNHTIWLRPTEGEDWGTLHDDTYHSIYRPNLLCVIVSESQGTVSASWSQARAEVSGDGWARCDGTTECPPDPPEWWYEAMRKAEQHVRSLIYPGGSPEGSVTE